MGLCLGYFPAEILKSTWDNHNLCYDASLTDCTMTAFVQFCPKIIGNKYQLLPPRNRKKEKIDDALLSILEIDIPYMHHYKPWLVYFLPQISLQFI